MDKLPTGLIVKAGAVIAVLVAILIINPFKIIGAGERGVLFSRVSGVQELPLNEGINFVMPFVYTVEVYDVRIQKLERRSECSTADLQDINVTLAINYHIDEPKVAALHQNIGEYYREKVIFPAMEESLKAATALYRIEEVITKRQQLREQTMKNLASKLERNFLILDDVSIVNIAFSESYTQSVEEKQIQEQKIKTEEYKRKQAEEEAKRIKVLAQAKGQSQRELARSANRGSIALEWIKKWDGKLPTYMGGDNKLLMPVK